MMIWSKKQELSIFLFIILIFIPCFNYASPEKDTLMVLNTIKSNATTLTAVLSHDPLWVDYNYEKIKSIIEQFSVIIYSLTEDIKTFKNKYTTDIFSEAVSSHKAISHLLIQLFNLQQPIVVSRKTGMTNRDKQFCKLCLYFYLPSIHFTRLLEKYSVSTNLAYRDALSYHLLFAAVFTEVSLMRPCNDFRYYRNFQSSYLLFWGDKPNDKFIFLPNEHNHHNFFTNLSLHQLGLATSDNVFKQSLYTDKQCIAKIKKCVERLEKVNKNRLSPWQKDITRIKFNLRLLENRLVGVSGVKLPPLPGKGQFSGKY